jgi:hypothetical protein
MLKTLNDNYNNIIEKNQEKIKSKKKETNIRKLFYYKKYQTEHLSESYLEIAKKYNDSDYQNRAFKVLHCCDDIEVAIFSNNKQKITSMHSCQDRLHLTCNWRRSLKTFAKLSQVLNSEQFINKKYRFIFLTLTLRAVKPVDLKQGINHIFYSFKKFLLNKRIKAMNKGFFRGLEITFNDTDKTFHHHIHCVFVVDKSYFTNSKIYLKQSDYSDIWQKSADIDYTPIIDIRTVKNSGGLAEISKYSVSADEKLLLSLDIDELKILRDNLTDRRLIGMGGVVRAVARLLKVNLTDDNKLTDNINGSDIKDEILRFLIGLKWSIGLGKYKIEKKETVDF